MQNNTPYDTGKVKIGLLYTPPPPPTTPEDDWIQGVLLGDKQGLNDLETATICSLIIIVFIVTLLLGGNYA